MARLSNLTAAARKERIGQITNSLEKSTEDDAERIEDLVTQLSLLIHHKSDFNKRVVNVLRERKRHFSPDSNHNYIISQLLKKMKKLYKNGSVALNNSPMLELKCPDNGSNEKAEQKGDKIAATEKNNNGNSVSTSESIASRGSNTSPTEHKLLPEGRRKIITALCNCLEQNAHLFGSGDEENTTVRNLSQDIEKEINRHYPFADNVQSYQAKVRQIYSQLKNIEVRNASKPCM